MKTATWRECIDTEGMLAFLEGKTTDRKLRLFAVACCRNIWELLDERSQRAVEIAASYANGVAEEAELKAAWAAADQAATDVADTDDERSYNAALAAAWTAVEPSYCSAAYSASHAAFYAQQAAEDRGSIVQENFLRDIVSTEDK